MKIDNGNSNTGFILGRNICIKFTTTRHFADDTNLYDIIDRTKLIRNRNPTRKLNIALRSIDQWLITNKISLNATKAELTYFRDKRAPKPITKNCITLAMTTDVSRDGATISKVGGLNFL